MINDKQALEMTRHTLQEIKSRNGVHLFKNIFPITPTWGNFINHLDYAMHQPDEGVNERKFDTTGHAHFWERLTITIDHSDRFFPNVRDLIETISRVYDHKAVGALSIISFSTTEPTTGKHLDCYDIFYWQCVGSVDWLIGDENPVAYTLDPGDVIFVTAGTIHEVKPHTPRAAVSLMFNFD